MSQKVDPYLRQGPDLVRLKGIVEFWILGQFGVGSVELIQNIHTPKGFQKMMSTPLWECGNVSRNRKDDALAEFGPFQSDQQKGRHGLRGLALDKLLPCFFGRTC